VLVGANGAGKSNLVGFFHLLKEMVEQRLQVTIRKTEGGADSCLFLGPKTTEQFTARIRFGRNAYEFVLQPTADNQFVFARETVEFSGDFGVQREDLGAGHSEAKIKGAKDEAGVLGWRNVSSHVYESIASWVVYHFHDTSLTSAVRRQRALNDNLTLRPNAENLAPYLFRLRQSHPRAYGRIRDVVRLAAPFFDDFVLRPMPENPDWIQLEWRQTDSDYPFRAHQLSDGTLRFICLATALLQPNPPATILFDEPEIGLHPYALSLLAGMLQSYAAGGDQQVIVSTQSVQLLSEFAPEDVVVVDRENGESLFRRLDSAELSEWLAEYTVGELWQKNVIGGGPRADRLVGGPSKS